METWLSFFTSCFLSFFYLSVRVITEPPCDQQTNKLTSVIQLDVAFFAFVLSNLLIGPRINTCVLCNINVTVI